jgi:hypothetical protein
MNLEEARKEYYAFSSQASAVARQLAFAGIALVWIFKNGDGSDFSLSAELTRGGLFLAGSLLLDFCHYAYAAAAWGIFSRIKERSGEAEFLAPAWINWPTICFFWGKMITVGVGFTIIARFLLHKALA